METGMYLEEKDKFKNDIQEQCIEVYPNTIY